MGDRENRLSGKAGSNVRRGRWNSQRHRSSLMQVIRDLVLVWTAVAWGIIVWVWPGLQLGNDTSSRGLQPAVLIAAASIQAAVVLFGLAVGAIVLQVMAKYSWAVVRSVLPAWLAPVLELSSRYGWPFPRQDG